MLGGADVPVGPAMCVRDGEERQHEQDGKYEQQSCVHGIQFTCALPVAQRACNSRDIAATHYIQVLCTPTPVT